MYIDFDVSLVFRYFDKQTSIWQSKMEMHKNEQSWINDVQGEDKSAGAQYLTSTILPDFCCTTAWFP